MAKIEVNQFYNEEKICEYKGETYLVRNNGAIMRLPPNGKKKRPKDGEWTFGHCVTKGYVLFCNERVHRIVATAFHGEAPTKEHVVDHIDTNRQNNRPENLRWLTRLENILLNETTRKKIEFLCGSVESFLENPSQLKGHEIEDSNFSWMRAVSPIEAQNTKDNWKNLISQPRPIITDKRELIGEWIYEKNNKIKEPIPSIRKITTSKKRERIIKTNNPVKPNKGIPKEAFIKSLIQVCNEKKWNYKRNYKTDKWKCDILITTSGKKPLALSASSSQLRVEKDLNAIMAEGVTAFGFVLKGKSFGHSHCFDVDNGNNSFCVSILNRKEPLADFIDAIVSEKITEEESFSAIDMSVVFEPYECYFCKKKHHVYFVRGFFSANGYFFHKAYLPENKYSFIQFSPIVINNVMLYIEDHPENDIKLGSLKQRNSKTTGTTYMSFGCPYCDGIVGQHYLDERELEVLGSNSEEKSVTIHLSEPIEIKFRHWRIK